MININLIKDVVLKSYKVIPNYFMPINSLMLRYIPILAITIFADQHFQPMLKLMGNDYSALWVYALVVINLLAQMLIPLLIARMIILNEHPGQHFFNFLFSKMSFKMIGFMIPFILTIGLLIASAFYSVNQFQSPINYFLIILMGLIIFYFGFKLALVPQFIAMENKIGIRQSFVMMRGQILNLIVIMIVVMIPIVILAVLSFILMPQYMSTMTTPANALTMETHTGITGILQILMMYLAIIPNAAQTYLYKYLK